MYLLLTSSLETILAVPGDYCQQNPHHFTALTWNRFTLDLARHTDYKVGGTEQTKEKPV